ncbi:uncharacterized protein LOC110690566 [Chenopodium quinoa]|uniref:uncharacterized protein LOC110690566 n=1 Tax=Chenopodium quinoa TaxID=63459 RepID=UPI000B794103|nr:uncharacterized protein LOC110690566 [Chenopodium quinoa]
MPTTTIDPISPLYLHPSDGQAFVGIEKLQGSSNFRSWKRSMEIALAGKRKLGFVTGTLKKDHGDEVKSEAWETCNSMIISWILGSVSDSIKQSIMFVNSSSQIWTELERRFSLTNGSRKYKLNKDLYETKHQGKKISEYYTKMKAIWEELESLHALPVITNITSEVSAFLTSLNKQMEEHKLFQFLNGLDDEYGPQRSQLLMMTALPSVETACCYLEQEESQRSLFNNIREDSEPLVMFSRGSPSGGVPSGGGGFGRGSAPLSGNGCTACGKAGHMADQYWTVVGYPTWHAKYQQKPVSVFQKGKGKIAPGNNKWGNRNKGNKVAANVSSNQSEFGGSSTGSTNQFTVQQIEALLKMLPKQSFGDNDEETDHSYAGMVSCHFAESIENEWIIDSGASDHMTGYLNTMHDVVRSKNSPQINLPTGQTANITHFGSVNLGNNLSLKNVLYVPSFKHNLISVNKLMHDSHSKILFYPKYCIIHDLESNTVKGIGRMRSGLYYLENKPIETVIGQLKAQISGEEESERKGAMNVSTYRSVPTVVTNVPKLSSRTLWHHRLGHAPI